ncbi:MAG: hypothetical protein IT359_15625 [Gemmatimonadaceae bacterium]|nr:hypothetical protein [Gemmatimonadaceae bacterium]
MPLINPRVRRAASKLAAAAVIAAPLVSAGCLAGPSTAIGGGPIGRAPSLRETELLPVPDSTRGVGFILFSNRRDLVEETRVELNAAARAYDRLFGERPAEAVVRLESDQRAVQVSVRVGARQLAPFPVSLRRDDGGRPRVPEAMHVASAVVLATAREWMASLVRDLVPTDSSTLGWMSRESVPAWLRLGLLQGVAESPVHELWLTQLALQRDSLPSVAEMWSAGSCDAACLAPFVRDGDAGGQPPLEASARLGGRLGRGRLPPLEGRMRYAAATYSLLQFISKREGPDFMRDVVRTALTGGNVIGALAAARSFTADPSDIDRQWRVWLAPFAYPDRP